MTQDHGAGAVVFGRVLEPVGAGRMAVYYDLRHGCCWYYLLHPSERLDLGARRGRGR